MCLSVVYEPILCIPNSLQHIGTIIDPVSIVSHVTYMAFPSFISYNGISQNDVNIHVITTTPSN